MNDVPQVVLDEAVKNGLGEPEYIGRNNGAMVYGEISKVDEDGIIVPTGLPCYVLLKDGNTEFISGLEALRIDITD